MSDSDDERSPPPSEFEEDSPVAEAESSAHESREVVETETKPSSSQTKPGLRRKRRRNTDGFSSAPRIKRLKGRYNDDYRELYNTAVAEISNRFHDEDPASQGPSQIGLSFWTAKEKTIFFSALGKLGRDDLPGLAAAIGTKSMQEVREYILLLKAGVVEVNLNPIPTGVISFVDIPAANELSEPCCNALNLAGESLAWHQERWERKQEQQKNGNLWLLSFDTVDGIESEVSEADDETDPEQDNKAADVGEDSDSEEPLSAMTVLKLNSWLNLSMRIFMNPDSPKEDENWRTIADPGEIPGIYRTAFEDFYSLTVRITQRIIQVSIFQAMSRLRATDTISSTRPRKPFVRRGDVRTALDILGLKHDSKEYWRGVPRRCNIRVYEGTSQRKNEKDPSKSLSYDQAEGLLSGNLGKSGEGPNQTAGPLGLNMETTPDGDLSSEDDSIILSKDESTPPDVEQLIDEYADLYDKHTSLAAEHQLWELLEEEPPPEYRHPDLDQLPKKPAVQKKTATELRDWRDWTEYESFWETVAKDPLEWLAENNDDPEQQEQQERQPPSQEKKPPKSVEMVDLPIRANTRLKKPKSTGKKVKPRQNSDADQGPSEKQLEPRSSAPRRAKDAATTHLQNLDILIPDDLSDEEDYDPMDQSGH